MTPFLILLIIFYVLCLQKAYQIYTMIFYLVRLLKIFSFTSDTTLSYFLKKIVLKFLALCITNMIKLKKIQIPKYVNYSDSFIHYIYYFVLGKRNRDK